MNEDIGQSMPISPDSKVHGANMGPTWVLSSPGGPHVGPMNLAIWVINTDWVRHPPVGFRLSESSYSDSTKYLPTMLSDIEHMHKMPAIVF